MQGGKFLLPLPRSAHNGLSRHHESTGTELEEKSRRPRPRLCPTCRALQGQLPAEDPIYLGVNQKAFVMPWQ